jgi:hypothetical protein
MAVNMQPPHWSNIVELGLQIPAHDAVWMQGHAPLQLHAVWQTVWQFANAVRPMDDTSSTTQRAKAAVLGEVALTEAIDMYVELELA